MYHYVYVCYGYQFCFFLRSFNWILELFRQCDIFYAFDFISKLGEGFNYDSFLRLRSDKNIFQIYKHLLLLVPGGNLDDIQRMHRKGTVVLVGKAAIVKFVSVNFIFNNYPNEKMY